MVRTRVVLRRDDSTSICSITLDELLAVNVRGASAKLSRGLARDRGALNGSETPEQQKRNAPSAKQLHLLTSPRRSARLDFGHMALLLTALNTEHPSVHHRLQDPTPQPHTTSAHSACK